MLNHCFFGLYLVMMRRLEQKNEKERRGKKYTSEPRAKDLKDALSPFRIDYVFFSTFIPFFSSLQPEGKSVSVLCVCDRSPNQIKETVNLVQVE